MERSGRSKAPSMVDVAHRAGVALVTVSRVVNEHPAVRPETRARVLAAIAELGYRRNDVARALKSGQSLTLAVVIAGSDLFELPRVLFGMELAASEAGYGVSLARWEGQTVEPLAAVIDRLAARGADGVIVIADRPVAVGALEQLHVPTPLTVVMSGDIDNPSIGSVEFDQDLGARLLTRHLLDLNHRDIAHISGTLATYDARARVRGWRDEMRSAGVTDPELIEGIFDPAAGYRAGLEIARRRRRPTAVFAGNDLIAMGVLAAFAEAGISVPGDVSLVGFDDMPGAGYLVPALTTVRQDHLTQGRRAVEVLLGTMAGEEPRHHLIAPTLVERRSTRRLDHEATSAG